MRLSRVPPADSDTSIPGPTQSCPSEPAACFECKASDGLAAPGPRTPRDTKSRALRSKVMTTSEPTTWRDVLVAETSTRTPGDDSLALAARRV